MPTAARLEKQSSNDSQEPQKLVHNLVEKKIRNLEKRKARLQELRDLEAKGHELQPEQQIAIKKLEQVVEMIELMKDLNKSVGEVFSEHNKQQKKLAKKEQLDKQLERQQQELDRIKTIIRFQDILARFDSTVRQDFLKGTKGAIKLSEEELSHLDKLYNITSDLSDKELESSAEKLLSLAEGKPREAWTGVTFHQLKELLTKIVNCKYFNSETTTPITTTLSPSNTNKSNVVTNAKTNDSIKQYGNQTESSNTKKSTSIQFQSATNSDVMNFNQLQSQLNSNISFMRDPIVENELQHKDPAVVAVASVQNYPYHQYGVQTSEQLVSAQISNSIPNSTSSAMNAQKISNFESVSSIPTQTFTNQNYAAAYVSVPVTLATVHSLPMPGIVPQELSPHHISSTDLGVGQQLHNYPNHQNYMDSNQENKHQNTSQERGTDFHNDDNNGFRNNRMRGRGGNARTNQTNNVNGFGNRPRNANKGSGGFQVGSYGYQKYENNTNNSSSFGNNFEKGSNSYSGNRGRQQNRGNRTDRGPNNRNFNTNYNTTTTTK
jgi:hypothetical protein